MHNMCMSADEFVIRLLESYAAARQIAVTSACVYAAAQARLVDRLRAGSSITTRRVARIAQWISDNWPTDHPWPADIPRPALSPPNPSAPPADETAAPPTPGAAATRKAIRETVAAARERRDAAAQAGDVDAIRRHNEEAIVAALTLNGNGQLADPEALCAALGVRRHVYDDVRRRYAGHPERQPRNSKEAVGRMVAALRLSGDRRFINPAHTHSQEAA